MLQVLHIQHRCAVEILTNEGKISMVFSSIFNGTNEHLYIKGKFVLLTGAAQGIGYEIAVQFAKAGAQLILTDIDKDKLNNAQLKLSKYASGSLYCYEVDVADK